MRVYEGFAGTLLECAVKKRRACELCVGGLAIGDPVWSRGAEPQH
jgi:hypothetical protein